MNATTTNTLHPNANLGVPPKPSEVHQRAGGLSQAKETLVIGSKAQADKVLVESLFKPVNGQTLKRERYDMGKYAHNLKGKTVEVIGGTVALWMERRKDSHGPYWALFCLSAA